MTGTTIPAVVRKRNALLAICAGGMVAGTLDLLQACVLFGLGHSPGDRRWPAWETGV